MVTTLKIALFGLTLASLGLACGQTSQRAPDATIPLPGDGGEGGSGAQQAGGGGGGGAQDAGGAAGVQQGGSGPQLSAAGAGGAEAESKCVAFCTARQIHIEHCSQRDGAAALRETFEACFQSSGRSEFDLCPTDPSCGGWLAGCLVDAADPLDAEAFPPNTTCADSVAAKLFRPSP